MVREGDRGMKATVTNKNVYFIIRDMTMPYSSPWIATVPVSETKCSDGELFANSPFIEVLFETRNKKVAEWELEKIRDAA
jgi:hypothetical protein